MLKYGFEDYVMATLKATITKEDLKTSDSLAEFTSKTLRFADAFSRIMAEVDGHITKYGSLGEAMENMDKRPH